MKIDISIPNHYCDKAREELLSIIETLNNEPTVSKLDTAAINLLGSFMDTYYKAQEIVEREGMILKPIGSSPKRAHPATKIMHDAGMKVYRLMVQFNMTPESRAKNGRDHDDSEMSPLEKIFGSKIETR
jgi:P27 family predicted phage terminase small subunit